MSVKHSFLALIGILLLTACQNDNIIHGEGGLQQEWRDLPVISEIVHRTVIPIYLTQDSLQEARLEGSASLLPFVQLKVSNGVLDISLKEGYTYEDIDVSLFLSVSDVEKISLRSTGNLIFLSDWKCDSITLENRMSAEIASFRKITANRLDIYQELSSSVQLEVKTSELTVNAIDASKMILSGEADKVEYYLSQTSLLNAMNLLTRKTTMYHHSTKTAKISVSDSLNGRLGSTGDLWYFGSPAVSMDIQGTGAIIPF